MITFDFKKRVHFGETDQMGYLYHGHYAQYYEIGRTEWLRDMGLSYRQMEEEYKIMMPVVSLQMRFVRPGRYDELLTIRTMLKEPPGKFITFHMEIYNENNKLVNGGKVRLCFVNMKDNKTISAPDFLVSKIKEQFEAA